MSWKEENQKRKDEDVREKKMKGRTRRGKEIHVEETEKCEARLMWKIEIGTAKNKRNTIKQGSGEPYYAEK